VAYALQRKRERAREPLRPGLVALQQVIGHALRGFWTDSGEAT
jgi:hypothetical protein